MDPERDMRMRISVAVPAGAWIGTPSCLLTPRVGIKDGIGAYKLLQRARGHVHKTTYRGFSLDMLDPYSFELRWQHIKDTFLAVLAEGTFEDRRLGRATPEKQLDGIRGHLDERWTNRQAVAAKYAEHWHRSRMRDEERRQRNIARRAASAAASERKELARAELQERAAERSKRRRMAAEEARQRKDMRLRNRLAMREHRGMLQRDRAARQSARRKRVATRFAERKERRQKGADRHVLRTEREIDRLLRRWGCLEAAELKCREQTYREQARAERETRRQLNMERLLRWRHLNRRDVTMADLLGG
eukprot:TRINITY_DN17788_c0_g1_i2.p1 TRINITY_DN17788_c0_g1~~TRINITY_DN17788_c0_g1_i2.p1  ORF type:complete len:348 (+),score=54.52 TRINITY_DN17788_c0_g1_i2:134-1045(+)